MIQSDREDFDRLLRELCAAIGIPCTDERLEGFWKGLRGGMSFAEFARIQEIMIKRLEEGERPKTIALTDIWNVRRGLMARAPVVSAAPEPYVPGHDDWWRCANRHLLAHIMQRVARRRPAYTRDALTVLLPAKDAFAQDMRDVQDASGEVPVEVQKASWSDFIDKADAQIEARRAQREAA